MILFKINCDGSQFNDIPIEKQVNNQSSQMKLKKQLESIRITDTYVKDVVRCNYRLQFILAESCFWDQGTYSFLIKADDFMAIGPVLLRLFKYMSCWLYSFKDNDVWRFNLQGPTDYGKTILSYINNSLLDRLFIASNGRVIQEKTGLYLCQKEDKDLKLADRSNFTANLIDDELFFSADLSSITLEQAQSDPFVLATACSRPKVYLYSGNYPDETNSPFLYLWL